MRKSFNIQLDYVCITALVIAMAMIAFCICCDPLPVKTLLLVYICVDLFVAVPTQHALILLAEGLVAFFALFLVFQVPFNHLTWINQ